MDARSRLLAAITGRQGDHVPAAPDFWEMIPIKMLDKPSWEMLVYQDPPRWKAMSDAYAYFGVDAFIPIVVPFEDDPITAIVHKTDEKLIVRHFTDNKGIRQWSRFVQVYTVSQPCATVTASSLGMPEDHEKFEIVKPNFAKTGESCYRHIKDHLGNNGLVLPMVCLPAISHDPEEMYRYFDDPDSIVEYIDKIGLAVVERVKVILSWKPDVLLIGNSGLMLFNPPDIFRQLSLKWLKEVTALAKEAGVPTHMHCCGPERALVEIAAMETDLNSIEPLENPPMGDCDLSEIKKTFGGKLSLKGNLHTTEIMLFGTVEKVKDACKQAIDDAAEGGGFILSTGDQTPMDTPFDNIFTMQKVAETYGKYD